MNLGELRKFTRTLADDLVEPFLWTDDELDAFLNEAQREACRRSPLLLDSTSSFTQLSFPSAIQVNTITQSGTTATVNCASAPPAAGTKININGSGVDGYNGQWPITTSDGVSSFTFTAPAGLGSATGGQFAQPFLIYDPRIIQIKRGKINGVPWPIEPLSAKQLDLMYSRWEVIIGVPIIVLNDLDDGGFRLYPAPLQAGVLQGTVQRLPLADMVDDSADSPEIRKEYHEKLAHWALYRAYSKDDVDTLDPNESNKHLGLFEAEFGSTSARFEEFRRQYGRMRYYEPMC